MDWLRLIGDAVAPLGQQLRAMILRAVVSGSDATQQIQTIDLDLGDEQVPGAEHFEPFGLTGNPVDGAEVVVVFLGGTHDNPIAVSAVDRQHRPTGLAKGESAVYNGHGTKIVLAADGSIAITVGMGQKVTVNGDVQSTVGAMTVSLLNHTHSATPTSGPGGLVSGAPGAPVTGTTGGPV